MTEPSPEPITNACCKAEKGSYFLVERGASCGGIPLSDLIDCTGSLAFTGTFAPGSAANANRALFGGSLVHDAEGKPTERCRRASFLDTAKVVGDDATQTWYMETVGCSVAPLSLPTLLKILIGSPPGSTAWHNARGSIVFMGDSHTRNSFSALVAGIRGLHNAVEEIHGTGEMKKSGFMIRYVVYRDATTIRDSLELFNETDIHPPPVRCPSGDDSGLFCVDVLFVWAPIWDDMIKRLPLITRYTPAFVVGCTGNTYEKMHATVSREMTAAWEAFAMDPPTRRKLRAIVFTHWPYGQSNYKEKIASYEKWIEEVLRGQRFLLSDIYSLQKVYTGKSLPRLKATWHTMCNGIRTNSHHQMCNGVSAHAIMDAYGNCSVATEYINVRAMLTLAEHTPEVTTPGNCVENCLRT